MNIEEVREALIEWENLSTEKKNCPEYEVRLRELRYQLSNLEGYYRKGKEEGLKEGFKEGFNVGFKEGIKEGLNEGRSSIARILLKKGFSLTEISKLTELTEDEIHEL